jgi:hypothetical protein
MKHIKLFRILALAVVLSLLMVAVPATPALAFDYDIDLDPEQGKIGDEITVTGDDWSPSYEDDEGEFHERRVGIYFSADEADVNDYIDDEVEDYDKVGTKQVSEEDESSDPGDFERKFDVPDELKDGDRDRTVEPGTYYVYVTKEEVGKRIYAVAEFTVVGEGDISIDPDDGPVGTEVEISGSDFSDNEDIEIEYDGDNIDWDGDKDTDGDGDFDASIIIPPSTAGDHEITVKGEDSLAEVTDTFTVEPEITVSPEEGGVQSTATVSGTGFASRSDITVYLDGSEVDTATTDSDGSFEATFTVGADLTPDSYNIEAEDEENNTASADFAVVISISASVTPTSGHIGTEVTATGAGYPPGATITIKYDTDEIATLTAGTDGTFSTTFDIPPGQSGEHKITISNGTTEEFPFTVESEAPSTPRPLLPAMGIEAEQPVQFDWADVPDVSPPVTYTLQIATSSTFSASSIVLEETGLTGSKFTIGAANQLEELDNEQPYFWRIKATDGAGNESDWTGAGEFFVGGGGGTGPGGWLPTWLRYLLFALGGLLIAFLGFWLVRRS